ncbi:hypothetical protein NTP67_13505 [Providencia rettgeri]|uniref:hypothetical protein n=1 Tax=Providencia rettgeri TaxID=587 RepID=UPI00221F4F6D|nr:hypothetical protein [Providencia rettgeri]ELR5278338.1 hypothetical protein [Providencia rettgeri]UYV40251.1 hypothetical protein NTP67_13505 [Providencia rettgeri]
MKKYLLGVSIIINVILAIALITTIMMFFNIKSKINTMVEQIKSGEYIELVKQNSQQLLPDSLKELSTIEITDNPCGYFYQKVDSTVEYLNNNPDIIGAETYASQLTSLKGAIDKTPSVLKEKACRKGISSFNYIIESIQSEK